MTFKRKTTFMFFAVFFMVVSVLPVSAFTKASQNKISNNLLDRIQGSSNSTISVIVQTTTGIKQKHREIISSHNGKFKEELSIINGCSADLPVAAIKELAFDKDVTNISFDEDVHICLDVAASAVGAPKMWSNGLTGRGITVAVVDTGVYPHPDLIEPNNRIVAFKDLVNNRKTSYDDCGHGTHVAGIIGGNGKMSGGKYTGIAPEVNLVGVKVLDSVGAGKMSTVISGIQWVVQNKENYDINIINLSLGVTATEPYTIDPLSLAVGEAWAAGLVVVAAAGNGGPETTTITSPGINPDILTVGACDDHESIETNDDSVASQSSRGPTIDGLVKPDLIAPGVGITSIAISSKNKKNSDLGISTWLASQANAMSKYPQTTASTYYITMSGTSMATPMVSGAAALLLQQNPGFLPVDIKTLLKNNAVSLGLDSNIQGAGIINLSFIKP